MIWPADYLNKVICGDCLEILAEIPNASIDAVVTDPPYGLSFMGKHWDYDVPKVAVWAECLRVLKPGGHLLSFAGTRTYHRMAVNIEDAGFEIRDMIAWVYGSGFPKSLNIGKAVDRLQGNDREVVGKKIDISTGKPMSAKQAKAGNGKNINAGWDRPWRADDEHCEAMTLQTKGTSEWEGWGTALKPALEPICVARKPLVGTVAANVLQYGTGGINVDGCRVDFQGDADRKESTAKNQHEDFGTPPMTGNNCYGDYSMVQPKNYNPPGRFPANLIHDGSEEVLAGFPNVGSGNGGAAYNYSGKEYYNKNSSMFNGDKPQANSNFNDSGSAARFFYCAKASKEDRDGGCHELDPKQYSHDGKKTQIENAFQRNESKARNNHPTVKPTDLMRYLCRLVTPPNGIILDPFFGSGSTGKAAKLEHFNYIGIEREAEYCEIAQKRIDGTLVNRKLQFEVKP
jgi:site-specific DNA-methyltransferase (adenine-specific)